jgi:tagatose-6-phosphate ketose/aldose isomerase
MREIHVKGLGMKKIAVCSRSGEEIKRYIDYAIELDPDDQFHIPDQCRPMMDVTVGQMLGLFKSLDLNMKPDNPSERGVISRVVKGVKVYDPKKYKEEKRFGVLAE